MTTGASQRRNGGVSPATTGFVPLLDVGGFDRRAVLLAGESEALAALDAQALVTRNTITLGDATFDKITLATHPTPRSNSSTPPSR